MYSMTRLFLVRFDEVGGEEDKTSALEEGNSENEFAKLANH